MLFSNHCDFNISVQEENISGLGERTELKHIAKLSSIRECVNYEIQRQIDIIEDGQEVITETRGIDLKKGVTTKLRDKESYNDYRFMPEPDLPLINIQQVIVSIHPPNLINSLTFFLPEIVTLK